MGAKKATPPSFPDYEYREVCTTFFVSVSHLITGRGSRRKSILIFHEVERAPELEISKIDNQNRCHVWHVAHIIGVVFLVKVS